MLIIRRRPGENISIAGDSISVDGEVEIEILEIRGGKVKLGVKAPDSVAVIRGETLNTREQNRRAAVGANQEAVSQMLRILGGQAATAGPANRESTEPAIRPSGKI
jgi:carbon storage regulator CsrA